MKVIQGLPLEIELENNISKMGNKVTKQEKNHLTLLNKNVNKDDVINTNDSSNTSLLNDFREITQLLTTQMKEVIQNSDYDVENYKNAASAIKNLSSALKELNDTMQLIPKMPSIAQQFNFNGKEIKNERTLRDFKENPREIAINYNILGDYEGS